MDKWICKLTLAVTLDKGVNIEIYIKQQRGRGYNTDGCQQLSIMMQREYEESKLRLFHATD